jgi:SnoaL-like polyketide cyclase
MTNDERMQRESSLIDTIRKKLPEFAKACADDSELVMLHQDSFAADYQDEEYTLLGMAIKSGKIFSVTGITVARLKEGKFVESWNNWDTLGLMQQLGSTSAASGRAA